MKDDRKTKEQLITELAEARRQMRDLEGFKSLFKKTEENLVKIRQRLDYFFTHNPAVLYAHEMKDGCPVTFVSANVVDQLGYEAEEFVADRDFWATHIHPDDRDQILSDFCLHFQAGRRAYEYRFLHKDGSYRWLRDEAKLIFDGEGTAVEWVGLCIDITERKGMEENLRISEEKYRRIVETAREGIWTLDADLKVVYTNRRMAEILGYTVEEVMGKKLFEFVHESSLPEIYRRLEKWRRGVKEQFDLRARRKDGTPLWVLINAMPVFDEKKTFTGIFSMVTDISKRKEVELQLQESEERYRIAVEGSNDGIAIVQGSTHLYVNKRFLDMFGYRNLDEINTADPFAMVHPDDRDMVKNFNSTRQSGGKVPSRYQYKGLRQDGAICYIEVSGTRIRYRGKPATLAFLRDITEHRRMEDALKESERNYRDLVDNALVGVFQSNINGDILYANDTCLRMRGFESLEEMRRAGSLNVYVNDQDRKTIIDMLRKSGKVFQYETAVLTKNGETVNVLLNANLKGDIISGMIMDISEMKRLEKEKEAMEARILQSAKLEAIGTLAGGIAHDFNNILAGIMGFSEMLLEDASQDSRTRRKLELILKSAHRGHDLVRQILTFSRQTEPEKKAVAMGPIVHEAMRLLRATIPSTIEIKKYIKVTDDTTLADPTQIHQVLLNLGTNAAHAMRQTGGVLEVSLTDDQPGPEDYLRDAALPGVLYMRFEVRDTGCGMAPEVMERIFEPFFTTKGPGEGTGMGLAMVHGIVKDHNGLMSVQSVPGVGTTFRLFLPKAHTAPTSPEIPVVVSSGKGRILFVDDEEVIAEMNKERLQRLGFEPIATTSSTEALELFRRNPASYDLVITDYTMPHMTGISLAKELRKIRPDIPIILFSGLHEPVPHEEAKKLDIKEIHLKPVSRENLATLIQRVIQRSENNG